MKKVILVLLYMMFFVFLFDPGDSIFGLKIPLFIILFILSIFTIWRNKIKIKKIYVYYMLFFSFLAILGLLLAIFSGIDTNFSFTISICSSFILIYIIFIFSATDIDVMECFNKSTFVICVIIIIIYFSTFFSTELHDKLYNFGNDHTSFTINFRTYAGIVFKSIYFHSSPMFTIALGYSFNKFLKNKQMKNLLPALIILIALFMTGSRSNMIISIIIPSLIYFFNGALSRAKISLIFCCLLGMILCSDVIVSFFDKNELSNSIKLSYLNDYMNFFLENPFSLFCGSGPGSGIYLTFHDSINYISEITYLNYIMWYGIFNFIIYMCFLIYPIIYILKNKKRNLNYIVIVWLCFLIMNIFNPFMFSSNGVTILCLVVFTTFKKEVSL